MPRGDGGNGFGWCGNWDPMPDRGKCPGAAGHAHPSGIPGARISRSGQTSFDCRGAGGPQALGAQVRGQWCVLFETRDRSGCAAGEWIGWRSVGAEANVRPAASRKNRRGGSDPHPIRNCQLRELNDGFPQSASRKSLRRGSWQGGAKNSSWSHAHQ